MSDFCLKIYNEDGTVSIDVDSKPSKLVHSVPINHVYPDLTINITPYVIDERVELTAFLVLDELQFAGDVGLPQYKIPVECWMSGNSLRVRFERVTPEGTGRVKGTAMVFAI